MITKPNKALLGRVLGLGLGLKFNPTNQRAQKIKETAIEAIDLAKRIQEATSEAFIVHVSIPKLLRKSTITIQAAKRPFPIGKVPLIQRAIGGRWDKANTTCNFTKLTQLRHSSSVRLIMNLYMRECLNPYSWDKVEVQQGTRGRVLTPQLCDGAEFAIMRGLGLEEETK